MENQPGREQVFLDPRILKEDPAFPDRIRERGKKVRDRFVSFLGFLPEGFSRLGEVEFLIFHGLEEWGKEAASGKWGPAVRFTPVEGAFFPRKDRVALFLSGEDSGPEDPLQAYSFWLPWAVLKKDPRKPPFWVPRCQERIRLDGMGPAGG